MERRRDRRQGHLDRRRGGGASEKTFHKVEKINLIKFEQTATHLLQRGCSYVTHRRPVPTTHIGRQMKAKDSLATNHEGKRTTKATDLAIRINLESIFSGHKSTFGQLGDELCMLLPSFVLRVEKDPARRLTFLRAFLKEKALFAESDALRILREARNALEHRSWNDRLLEPTLKSAARIECWVTENNDTILVFSPQTKELAQQLNAELQVIVNNIHPHLETTVLSTQSLNGSTVPRATTKIITSEVPSSQQTSNKEDSPAKQTGDSSSNQPSSLNLPLLKSASLSSLILPTEGSIRSFKEKHFDTLKGRVVKILDGKHTDRVGIFKSWNGSSAYVVFSGETKGIALPLDRRIQVFWT